MKKVHKVLGAWALVAAVLYSGNASASLSNGAVTPTSQAVTTTANTVSLTWSVDEAPGIPSVTVTSTRGTYRTPGGAVLGTNAVQLTSLAITSDQTVTFPETITVPASVIQAAAAAGAGQILYQRIFTDNDNPPGNVTVAITLNLASVSTLRAIPSAADVTPSRSTSVPFSWEINLTSSSPVTIQSTQGQFVTPSGASLGSSVNTALNATATTRTRLPETLSVPASVVVAALNRGIKTFHYRRLFVIDGTEYEGLLTLNIKGVLAGVDASPARFSVAANRSANVTVNWTARLAGTATGGITISSSGGTFTTPGGVRLGSFSNLLSRPAAGTQVSFSETVRVPRDVIYRAMKLGNTRLLLNRSFSDGFTTATGTVVLDITGGSAGGFTINRIDLRFPDGQRIKVVDRGGRVRVIADITYSGRGQLEADWEIASPITTGGTPIFRTVKLVRRHLGGFGQVRLESPPLPAVGAGQYLVRLRIRQPALQGAAPVIRYFVTVRRPRTKQAVHILAPAENMPLSPGLRFAWRPVPGAAYYQVEVYASDRDELVAALAVPASQKEVAFTRLAHDRLAPTQAYRWRAIAIDRRGNVVAASAFRTIRTP